MSSFLKILSLSVIGRQQSQQQEQEQHERLSRQATIEINIMLTITGRKVMKSNMGPCSLASASASGCCEK